MVAKKENEKEKAEDPCTAFGSYVARTLQLMDERRRLTAMNSVQYIIFQVQMSSINQNGNGHPGNFNTSFTQMLQKPQIYLYCHKVFLFLLTFNHKMHHILQYMFPVYFLKLSSHQL